MNYGITKHVSNFFDVLELSEEDYVAAKMAIENMYELLFLEEKLDLVVENYLEYETDLLSAANRFMMFQNHTYSLLNYERNLISRRIINLLTACRLYLDQSIHHLRKVIKDSGNLEEKVMQDRNNSYDTRFGYRVMESLRNYVQHRGQPIHELNFNSKTVSLQDDAKILYTLTPLIVVSELEADKKFKKAVLSEMKTKYTKIDAKPLIREYVECIGENHEKTRDLLGDYISQWEKTIDDLILLFEKEFGRGISKTGLALVTEENNEFTEIIYVLTDPIDRIKEFKRKNRNFRSLTHRYVSSEVMKNNA